MEKNIKEAISIIEDVRNTMPSCTNKAFLKGASNELNEALSELSKPVTLKAITYCYTDEGVERQKVVGIFKPEQLKEAVDKILKAFEPNPVISFDYDENDGQFLLHFDNEEKSWFYSGNYTVGELNL